MVAVAYMMNGTLVIPQLDTKSFWQDSRYYDLLFSVLKIFQYVLVFTTLFICCHFIYLFCSSFSDIFDELHFITSLRGDLRVVRELPKELRSVPRARKHFTSWSGMTYYQDMVESLKDYQVRKYFQSPSKFQKLQFDYLSLENCKLLS